MKCPYRINKTTKFAGGESELHETLEFADCYGTECPFYAPEYTRGKLTRPEHCARVYLENVVVRKEERHGSN